MDDYDLERLLESYDEQTARLQSLLSYRVGSILLVASLYDSFSLSEGPHLAELISGAYYDLSLSSVPDIVRASSAGQALELLSERSFDLVITVAQVGDMSASRFGQAAKSIRPELPVYLVAYSALELRELQAGPEGIPGIDRAFLWRGDVRLFLTIIKLLEDERNVAHDSDSAGVRVIVLVEDSPAFYSSYLPMLLTELVRQTSSLIAEEVNLGQRMLRRRLRPKVLLATSYEEAWRLYERYRPYVLCVISDVQYPRAGSEDPEAGLRLLEIIRSTDPDLPLLLQSSRPDIESQAARTGAAFLWKHSPTILQDIRGFMLERLGFGDFVFRQPDGTVVARAADVASMLAVVDDIPSDCLEYHGLRHDFANWLMARTEFDMASELRGLDVSDFLSMEHMREHLRRSLGEVQSRKRLGQVCDFGPGDEVGTAMVRIGGGSLGGKGRGLAFMHELLTRTGVAEAFRPVRVWVPSAAILGTDVFDRFIAGNGLLSAAVAGLDDRDLLGRFLESPLPEDVVVALSHYLDAMRAPLAVRSSSLLEDSLRLPAAGVYPTIMLGNDSSDHASRLRQVCDAIRHIYAATFFRGARVYLESTGNLVEDEKMAVVLQEIVGRTHGRYVYPDVSGTADSINFYPVREMEAHDGVAIAALGLGMTVASGERAVRFSPAHPRWLPQFSTPADTLENAQRQFRALDLDRAPDLAEPMLADGNVVRLPLDVAEGHGTLWPVVATYSPDDDAVLDGLGRPGVRLVTLAPILKHGVFPLPGILMRLLRLGELAMATGVQVEFAVDLAPLDGGGARFAVLQLRPQGVRDCPGAARLDDVAPGEAVVESRRVLGAGRLRGIRDLVVVRRETFDRARTTEVAQEIGEVNESLVGQGRHYVLIGPGRWGTADPWLGVPVRWQQVSGARAMVECEMAGLSVEPSQGTHFFHNVTSLGVRYFSVDARDGSIDWRWLESLAPTHEGRWVSHYGLTEPLDILVDAVSGKGVVLKREHSRPIADGDATTA